jgi:NDP-sugar pyrophosphorylase family protein
VQCVVLAGGFGTRLGKRTMSVPKVMVPVAGQPFVQRQLALLAAQGFTRVVLCIGHLGKQVRDFVGDGSRWGIGVEYADEGEDLRGTGGALRIASEAGLLDERFAVLYGDSYLPIDIAPVWAAALERRRPALMTVCPTSDALEVPNAIYENGSVVLYRKGEPTSAMHHIDYGLSVLARSVISDYVEHGVSVDLADVFHTLSTQALLAGFEVTERFYEIGSPTGLIDLEQYLADPFRTQLFTHLKMPE